ncbi:MAG: hypothetical protein ACK5NE_08490 [Brachymonas sp.]
MIYALFKALLLKPKLLAAHMRNYGELVRCEMQVTMRHWIVKAVAWLTMGVCLLLFLVLAGVAVMIGALQDQRHWILLLVPSIPLLMAVVALMVALRKTPHSPVRTIRQQFVADVAAFTGPAAKNHEQ